MNEMVERVARAIQDKCRERGFNVCPAPLVFHVAAAAIEAMREPTQAMLDAVDAEETRLGYCIAAFETMGCKDSWQAMIDAALK